MWGVASKVPLCSRLNKTQIMVEILHSQEPAFTCSKLTIETLEQVNFVNFLLSLLLTLNIFHILF